MLLARATVLNFIVAVAYLMPASISYVGDLSFLAASIFLLVFARFRLSLNAGLGQVCALFVYVCVFYWFFNVPLHDLQLSNPLKNEQMLKVAAYGILNFFVIISIFNSSKRASLSDSLSVHYMVFYSGMALSLINLGVWISQTGAVFSRYSYMPPIAGSYGVTLTLLVISLLSSLQLKGDTLSRRASLLVGRLVILSCMTTVLVREVWALFLLALVVSSIRSSLDRITMNSALFLLVATVGSAFFVYFVSGTPLMSDISGVAANDAGSSTTVRLLMVERAVELIFEHPWFGVGYGSYPLFVEFEVRASGGGVENVSSPHNGLILLLAELGFIGLLLWVFACWRLSVGLWVERPGGGEKSLPLRIFFILLLADQLISNSLFIPPAAERNVFPLTVVIWMMLGLLLRSSDESPHRPVVVSK